MGREDLVELTELLRRTRHDRPPTVSDFTEVDDDVTFTMAISGSDPDSSGRVTVDSRTTYRFRDDKVIDVWQERPQGLSDAVQMAGVDLG